MRCPLPLLAAFLIALGCHNAEGQDPGPTPKVAAKQSQSDPFRTISAGVGLGGGATAVAPMTRRSNGLRHENSPYLLQHAWNPVNWLPWSKDAFARAKKEDKPVFLSVGYSTCHWCHVMEKESFESAEIARILNKHFICVKLDREERPDLDEFYMGVVQAYNRGSGGWPMSLFLTHEGKAFIGATYFPPKHFKHVLGRIQDAWKTKRKDLLDQASHLTKHVLEQKNVVGQPGKPDLKLCEQAFKTASKFHDEEHGGFMFGARAAPKFPRGMAIQFLLRYHRRTGDQRALAMATKTLTEMLQGGMYDQLGGGFHRYSTDRQWLVPHFEKMLYDNGLLARVYADAWRITKNPEYLRAAREIVGYLQRDMVLPHGGISSAEDADSEGEEGLFYLWTPDQLKALLTAKEQSLVMAHFGVTKKGNFHEMPGRTILSIVKTLPETAKALGLSLEQAKALKQSARQKLLKARSQRIRPLRDDKVITAWNGLAIAGIANVARLTGDKAMLQTAQNAAAFVLSKLRRKDGRLLRRYRKEEARFLGILDDYAYLVDALLELFSADGQARWLKAALELEKETRRLFWDNKNGGFFKTASDVTDLLARSREATDGARPAASSVAASNMIRIAELTRDDSLRKKARQTAALEVADIPRYPLAYVSLLSVLEQLLQPARELVVVGESAENAAATLRIVHQAYQPDTVIVPLLGDQAKAVKALIPELTKGRSSEAGKTTVYLCKDRLCLAPMTKPEKIKQALK